MRCGLIYEYRRQLCRIARGLRLSTVETADRDSMVNKIVWANRIVRLGARLYHCGDTLYKIGR